MKKSFALLLMLVMAACVTGCGKKHTVQDTHTPSPAAYALADGTAVSVWEGDFDTVYCLNDGTELLSERNHVPVENVFVTGLAGFEGLAPAAQEAVRAYYAEQGLDYDLQALLEDAYAEHGDIGAEKFCTHMVEQSVYPAGETETISTFVTEVQRPLDGKFQGRIVESEKRQAVFHRRTGERLPMEALFAVPMEDVAERLVELTADDELPPDPAELRAGFSAERILWRVDGLTFLYPAGTLTGVETSMEFYFDPQDFAPLLYAFAGGTAPGGPGAGGGNA